MDAPESRRVRARRSQESCLTLAIAVDRSAAGGVFRCNKALFSESDAKKFECWNGKTVPLLQK